MYMYNLHVVIFIVSTGCYFFLTCHVEKHISKQQRSIPSTIMRYITILQCSALQCSFFQYLHYVYTCQFLAFYMYSNIHIKSNKYIYMYLVHELCPITCCSCRRVYNCHIQCFEFTSLLVLFLLSSSCCILFLLSSSCCIHVHVQFTCTVFCTHHAVSFCTCRV